MAWSRQHEECISCNGVEWNHRAKGFCSKCYPLVCKKEKIEQWDRTAPATLLAVGSIDEQLISNLIKWNDLEKAKESLIKQIDARLHLYKMYNSSSNVDPISIEYMLERISNITNNISDAKLFHGAVTRYREHFSDGQRRIIYRDLIFILINRKFNLDVWRDII